MHAWSIAFGTLLSLAASPALATSTIHLTNGSAFDAELRELTAGLLITQTPQGPVYLPTELVERIEHPESVMQNFERRQRQTDDTSPESLLELAQWCRPRGLLFEARALEQQAFTADPLRVETRRAMGQIRIGSLWVDAMANTRTPRRDEASQEENERRLVTAIQVYWERTLRQVAQRYFLGQRRDIEAGTEQLRSITDPLAIAPMFQLLSSSRRTELRLAIIDAFAAFDDPETTDYLVVAAVEDVDETVRSRALRWLAERNDPAAVDTLRRALQTEQDPVIRNAATALARLEAREAIPDLIAALAAERERTIEAPTRVSAGYLPTYYVRVTPLRAGFSSVLLSRGDFRLSSRNYWPRRPDASIGYLYARGSDEPVFIERSVTVFYTEVREALVSLTGEDFGFDEEAWSDWFRRQNPQPLEPPAPAPEDE